MDDSVSLSTPIPISEVDFRVQSINRGGYATILAYKSARVDMDRLDAVYGAGFWQRRHEVINGRLYCSVGVWNKEISQWVWVQDVGTESNTEQEKGQASDSFKRACFNLGIGRELYGYPLISIKLEQAQSGKPEYGEWLLNGQKPKQGYGLKLKEWVWYSEFDGGKISFIAVKDSSGKLRFKWGSMQAKKESK